MPVHVALHQRAQPQRPGESDGALLQGSRGDEPPHGRASHGRISTARPKPRWLFVLTALGFASLVASAALFAWGVHRWQQLLADQPEATAAGSDTRRAAHPGNLEPPPSAPSTTSSAPEPPASELPDETKSTQIGAIEVVDVGLHAAELVKVLQLEAKLARAKSQTMVLMVTSNDCRPCRAFDASLTDGAMQQALAGVRLVRVDLRAFKEELQELNLQVNVYPVFALLGPDMTPRDAIHGGEWDEDVAENIAPVLGEFVRGRYRARRHPEWSPTPGGMRL